MNNFIEHLNQLNDIEVINHETSNMNNTYIDTVINDHGAWDKLSDREFNRIVDKINSKYFTLNDRGYDIFTDIDPTGITLTLSLDPETVAKVKENVFLLDKQINKIVKGILKELKK